MFRILGGIHKTNSEAIEIAGKLIDRNAEKITISDWLASQRKTEDDVSFRIDALLSGWKYVQVMKLRRVFMYAHW